MSRFSKTENPSSTKETIAARYVTFRRMIRHKPDVRFFPEPTCRNLNASSNSAKTEKTSIRWLPKSFRNCILKATETIGESIVSSSSWGEDSYYELAGAVHSHVASPAYSNRKIKAVSQLTTYGFSFAFFR